MEWEAQNKWADLPAQSMALDKYHEGQVALTWSRKERASATGNSVVFFELQPHHKDWKETIYSFNGGIIPEYRKQEVGGRVI